MGLGRLAAFFRGMVNSGPRVQDPEALTDFMAGEASFIAQKCVVEYCRARAGLNWDKLFKEQAFKDSLEHSRWESFAVVLEDIAVLTQSRLRAADPKTEEVRVRALTDALAPLAMQALHRFGVPDHRLETGWADMEETIRLRLDRALLTEPQPAHEIARTSGKRVWELLPVHRDLRVHDRELIANNIRFNMCRCGDLMARRFAPGLADSLLRQPSPAVAA